MMMTQSEYKTASRITTFAVILIISLVAASLIARHWKSSESLSGLFATMGLFFALGTIALWWPQSISFKTRKSFSCWLWFGVLPALYLMLAVLGFFPDFNPGP